MTTLKQSPIKKLKQTIRKILIDFRIPITQNLRYDIQTKKIMRLVLKETSNCLDIGAHKGEILDDILHFAPRGQHYAFEPLPELFNQLIDYYAPKVNVQSCALSNQEGKSTFQMVENAPAYSGIRRRNYDDIKNPIVKEISVYMDKLDNVIPLTHRVDFIKIDIEGGEYHALLGGKELLKRDKPTIIFEFGNGASASYGNNNEAMYDYLTKEIGLNIYTLSAFLNKQSPLTKEEFYFYYITGDEYYFVASSLSY